MKNRDTHTNNTPTYLNIYVCVDFHKIIQFLTTTTMIPTITITTKNLESSLLVKIIVFFIFLETIYSVIKSLAVRMKINTRHNSRDNSCRAVGGRS